MEKPETLDQRQNETRLAQETHRQGKLENKKKHPYDRDHTDANRFTDAAQ